MSKRDYQMAMELNAKEYPCRALVMAAMKRANPDDLEALQYMFPGIWRELESRNAARLAGATSE